MKFHDRREFSAYESEYLAITFRRRDARMAFLGLDSGGRRFDRKNTYNLLKPALGAFVPGFAYSPAPISFESRGEKGFAVAGSRMGYSFEPETDRSFVMRFAAGDGDALPDVFWEMDLMIKTAPPSIWAQTKMDDPVEVEGRAGDSSRRRDQDDKCVAKRTWKLPMVIHFPDYGHVKVECIEGAADCRERLVKSDEMSGLNLGFLNMGAHIHHVGLHYGRSQLSFRPRRGASTVALRFTAMPEIAPKPLSGPDFTADPEWDGFRRCYMNGFTIHRPTMTMGDHINLAGYAHLAVQNKADLLDLSWGSPDPTLEIVRDVFVHQTDAAMRAQDRDGEINWDFPHQPKPEGVRAGAWLDCTPANMIAGCTCLKWRPDLAEKWYPSLVRAAGFLMAMDEDGDGLIESPVPGRKFFEEYPHPGRKPVNWWDNIAYGHKDAWFNLLSHRAVRLVADLAAERGEDGDAARMRAWLDKFDASFRGALVNPETGVVAGWRDVDGKLHDWLFTCPASMAVNESVIAPDEGRRMLETLLAAMEKEGFGDNRYGIPGNCKPIPLGTDTFDWAFMAEWPRYENGGLCGMTAWHFLNAMYRCGMEERADAIYFRMLDTFERMPTHSGLFPGYMESVDWRTKDGNPCGYNYLADNYLFLGAGFLAHTGREHSVFAPPKK